MSGDRSLAAKAQRGEHVSAALESYASVGHIVAIAGRIAQAILLLAARIWLSESLFVHQIMMMMRSLGFAETPSVGATLIRSVAPLLLATGLATRPVALLLVLGVGQGLSGTHLAGPQVILLLWLVIGGAGPLSLDFPLRGGLARVPVWAVRATSRIYARIDALGAIILPLGTRLYLGFAIAGADWSRCVGRCPSTARWSPHPGGFCSSCWALLFGVATRPVDGAPVRALVTPILSSGVTPDRFEVMLLLLLLAATGAGWASLDGVAAGWAALRSRMVDRSGEPLPHVVVVGGGFGGIAAVHALRWTACRITLIDRRNHYLFQPLLYQVATAALSPADIAIPIRSVLREQRNVSVRLGEVIGIDRAARSILLPEQRIPFDYLVLATGAQHSYFGRDEWAAACTGAERASRMRRRCAAACSSHSNGRRARQTRPNARPG